MKVKVKDEIYDGEDTLIMVILTDQDKKNIANMLKECTKYCHYNTDKYTEKEVVKWMSKT